VSDDAKITTLISEERLQARIVSLAKEIREVYGDKALTCVCVLKGSFVFLADLVRALGGDVYCEFLGVASYHGGTHSSGAVQITQDLRTPIEGRDVLVIEDIVDTGRTLSYLVELLRVRQPASLAIVTLLDKPSNRVVQVEVKFVGFEIPDEFVIGYGLDLGELYRNLPYIGVYSP
jgi:hypoxanthine phosphoribosyltransferase